MDTKSINSSFTFPEPLTPVHEMKASVAADQKIETQKALDNFNESQLKKNSDWKPSSDKMNQMVENINAYINQINSKVQFKIMRDYNNQTVIQVVDMERDKVIRQIPPDYLLKIEKSLAELTGLITDEKA